MTDKFETPITLKSAEQFVARHAPKDRDGMIDEMVELGRHIADAAERVTITARRITGNKMQTEAKNFADAKKAVETIFGKSAARIDAMRDRAERALDQLKKQMQPLPPKDAMEAMYHGEIRKAVAAMPQAERAKAITSAINAGDDQFAAAVLLANPLLVGLGDAEQKMLADKFRRVRHGDELQRIERVEKAQAEIERLAAMFMQWSLTLFKDQSASIAGAEESERLAKEAMNDVAA
jgi:hypothetical protein